MYIFIFVIFIYLFIYLYLFTYQFFYFFTYLFMYIYLFIWLSTIIHLLGDWVSHYPLLNSLPTAAAATAPGHLPAGLCSHFLRFLALPTRTCNVVSKKWRKNAKFQGFSPPKTVPKPSRNPSKFVVPGNMQNFIDFVWILWLVATAEHQDFCAQPMFWWLFTQYSFLLSARTSAPKNLPKTFPKLRSNHCKIEAEHVLFLNVAFFGFEPRFWSLFGFHLGAKLRILAYFSAFRPAPHCPPTVRRRPKGLRARFWSLQASIFEGLGLDFGRSGPLLNRFWKSLGLLWNSVLEDLWGHSTTGASVIDGPGAGAAAGSLR